MQFLIFCSIFKLRHVYTNKYIHVSTTETSIVDKSKMMVSLKPHNSKQAMFKILPMCKVKVEGEKVKSYCFVTTKQ